MNPSPEILFTVNFTRNGTIQLNSITTLQKSSFFPVDVSDNVIRKNNGQFTLYGLQAVRFKRLIDNGIYENFSYQIVTNAPVPPPTPTEFSISTDYSDYLFGPGNEPGITSVTLDYSDYLFGPGANYLL